jgi:hypothetical protein
MFRRNILPLSSGAKSELLMKPLGKQKHRNIILRLRYSWNVIRVVLYVRTVVTCVSVAKEQLGKHVSAKKNSWPTLGKGFSIVRQRTENKFRQHQGPCFLRGSCRGYITKFHEY